MHGHEHKNRELLWRGMEAIEDNAGSYIVAYFDGVTTQISVKGNHHELYTLWLLLNNDLRIKDAIKD